MRNPVKTAKRQLLRVGSCALSALMVLGSIPAAAIGDGVTVTYDEAYYAMTDYYGNLTDGSVVKSYRTNGIATLTDYGDYDEIINLTDGTVPARNGGMTTFRLDEKALPGTFYFEGKTTKPFQQLPWTISMSYTLNGVPTKAENLAGQAGVVEIRLDIVPNERASEYARNNYTLEAMTIFNQDDILSLEAPGAQVQLIGNLRAVLFLGLPGEECHYTIRVGSEDFSFGGMTFLMVPATLSQLAEIAKLSERKDDLEENYNKLSGSIDSLLDANGEPTFTWNGEHANREFGKMGKSLKNIITPDDMYANYGADTFRLYEMGMGPLAESRPWNTRNVVGSMRFLQRLWRNVVDENTGEVRVTDGKLDTKTLKLLNNTIADVTVEMEAMRPNTAIAKLIVLNNHLTSLNEVPRAAVEPLILMLSPIAPHICEELWNKLGHGESLAHAEWPKADERYVGQDAVTAVVQIKGKVRAKLEVPVDIDPADLEKQALEAVADRLGGKTPHKVIVKAPKIVSIVPAE